MTTHPGADSAGPRARLMASFFGFYSTQVMHAMARLDVCELLRDGPAAADQLGAALDADPLSLHRLLRAAVPLGLVTLDRENRFALTDAGHLLRESVPGSIRNHILLFGGDETWRSWGQLEYSVRTGETAWQHLFGLGPYEYMAAHPDRAAVFNEFAGEHTREMAPYVVAGCRLRGTERVADIGGGNGTLMSEILRTHPDTTGVLFDTESGLRRADRVLAEAGVRSRCELVAGDFMRTVPAGCDVYLLMRVIHNWDDDTAIGILRRCREGMTRDSVLYLIENVMPADSDLTSTRTSTLLTDLTMLVCLGGRVRTEAEFAHILGEAGLTLDESRPCASTGTDLAVLRAVLAG